SPEAIERSLLKHPGVKECLVFGVPNIEAERSEIIVGCIAAQEDVRADDLKRFLLAELPAWQIPRDWWFVSSLQVNDRGKLSRTEWRRRYLKSKLQNHSVP
ncbi:MAG: AMP-binding enzyme, partial [Limisphaerales bacterium]